MKRFIIALIRFYQGITPRHRRGNCRFFPTCSQYAVTAVSRFGVWRGGALSLWRFLRCNPFGRSGFDPVPERFSLFSGRGSGKRQT